MDFETVIGLEIHAQLLTETKLFCGCRSRFGDPANTNGCPVCLGLPGALPVLNRRAVAMAIRMGCAIGCTVAGRSLFARKNYFYPDLPKGYQISQYDAPLCGKGELPIVVDNTVKTVGVTGIHLEEDAGKLIHDRAPESLFDVNRCGTPLIEIVSEPDLRSPAEAYAFLIGIKAILEYIEICDCIMEEGSLRCDANISLRSRGEKKLGAKTEIKNMNSFRGVEKALEYEARRQEEVLRNGGKIHQETFLWDRSANRSIPMRSKEDAHDYRYFPEPDLPPLTVNPEEVAALRKTLPELPAQRRQRFIEQMGLQENAAEVLTSSRKLADFFEATLATYHDARQVANWIVVDILRIINDLKITIDQLEITPGHLGALLKLIDNGTISARSARKIVDLMQERDQDPETIIKAEKMQQVSDSGALENIVQSVLAKNPVEVERFKAGDGKLISFFVGQAMKATMGSGNPKEINALLSKMLR
ncbi:MAG: Asp-tRNA(Asn)/Glu-tRNA(Gln) amidotransferase subunit GatB [Chitinispirillaceae bacterium]|nr:Asp-tRNA(Asn)/Glu-tRNA(Gln) amidotransferase subunit GatB [Chitinispirillaceae bacterium]